MARNGEDVRLTDEQAAVVDAIRRGWTGKVVAFAGTGKTTTARAAIAAMPASAKVLYLVFNRKMAEDAKRRFASLDRNVDVHTFHGLACRFTSLDYSRLKIRISGAWLADKLGLQDMPVPSFRAVSKAMVGPVYGTGRRTTNDESDKGSAFVKASRIGLLAMETAERWAQSADRELSLQHVPSGMRIALHGREPNYERIPAAARLLLCNLNRMSDVADLRNKILETAHGLIDLMQTDDPDVPLAHWFYLKSFCLRGPRLPYDVIICDEAQDIDPAQLDLVRRQTHAAVYWFGDPYQRIYSWRGAGTAFDERDDSNTMYLTGSLRFPQSIADAATAVLRSLGETRSLRGLAKPSEPSSSEEQDSAILTRTNEEALEMALLLAAEKQPFVLGRNTGEDIRALFWDIKALRDGNRRPIGPLRHFQSFTDLLEYAKSSVGGDLMNTIDMVTRVPEDVLENILKPVRGRRRKGTTVISTVHQSKGLEWDRVTIIWNSDRWSEEEKRLAYVAVTRARRTLDCSALSRYFKGMPVLGFDEKRNLAWDPLADCDDVAPTEAGMPQMANDCLG